MLKSYAWTCVIAGLFLTSCGEATSVLSNQNGLDTSSTDEQPTDVSPFNTDAPPFHRERILVAGVEREFVLHVPEAPFEGEKRPLVVNLHGQTGTAHAQIDVTGMNKLADREGFAIAFPEGLHAVFLGAHQTQWDAHFGTNTNDIQFVRDLIDFSIGQFDFDPSRVYVVGWSNGGFMSYRAACELSDRIAAVASVAGQLSFPQMEDCPMTHKVPVLHFHGDADEVTPIDGIPQFAPSVDDTLAYLAGRLECESAPQETPVDDVNSSDRSSVVHRVYPNCTDGAALEYFRISGGGHTWPGAIEIEELGPTNRDISANEEIWAFVSRFKRQIDPNQP